MSKLKTETLTLKLVVNGDETRKQINDLEKAVVNSRDSIKGMRKEMELLAKQGQTDSARYKELTAAIKAENDAIKKNTASLNELRSKLSMNDMTIKELAGRMKTLRNELNRTKPNTKEWDQLNQELKATGARMRELGAGTNYTGGILGRLGKSVLPTFDVVTLGLKAIHAAGSLLKKGLQDLVSDTQKFADAWQQEVAAAEAVWHQFIRRISASRDEITLTYQEVAKLAREAAALKDEIFELQNSYNIKEADAQTRMQELEATFRATTLSVEERMAALDEMKQLELDLANDRLLIAKQAEDAAYKQFEIETALDREAAESFIENYLQAKKDGIVEAAANYELLIAQEQSYQRVFESGAFLSTKTYNDLKRQQDEIRAKIAATSSEVVTFFNTYRQYNLGEDTVTGAYAQAITNTRNAAAAADPSAMEKKYVRLSSQLKRGSGGSGSSRSWSLQSDESYLAAKAELTRRYNEGEIASQQEYEERLFQLEVSSLQARLDLGKEKGAERLKIENEIQEKTMAYNEKVRKANEKADEEEARARKKRLDDVQDSLRTEQEAHELTRQEIENEWDERLLAVKSGSEEEKQLQKQKNTALLAEDARYLSELRTMLEDIVHTGLVDGVELTSEELLAYKKKLAETIHLINQNAASGASGESAGQEGYSGNYLGDDSFFGVRQADWDLFFDNLEKGKLGVEDLGVALTAMGEAAQEGFKLANQAIQLTNAKEKKALEDYKKTQDSRKKTLEERFRAGLMTESQYNAEVEKMDAEMQAKQEQVELEQARRTKTISIIESIINTALAATKALAQGGFPAGAIMAGIVTALGAAQTAMIAAQPVGFAGGGFVVRRRQDGKQYDAVYAPDKRGYVDGPTVLVGEEGGEYVIPSEALANPQIRMIADTIESARRMGRLRSLRMEAISPALAISGQAAGGYTRTEAAAASSGSMDDVLLLSDAITRLNGILENGIRADVSMLGRHGVVERLDEYNRMKRRGQL